MLTLYHDYTSPASAVAVARVARLQAEGVAIRVVGTEAFGLDATLPVTLDLIEELRRVGPLAEAEGVALHRPTIVPPTASAHLVEDVAAAEGEAHAWRTRCYAAYWRDGRDISDPNVLAALATEVGLSHDRVVDVLADRLALLALRQRFAGHRREGIGGVPLLSYGGTLVPGLIDAADMRALAELTG